MVCGWTAFGGNRAPAETADRAAGAGAGADAPLERIAFGSCVHQDRPQPIWDAVLAANPDCFVFLGDNIYGDSDDMEMLRAKYNQLASVPGFQRLRAKVPVLATWDDHDYGRDDAGAEFPSRAESQQLFVEFWDGERDAPRRHRPGVYEARVFGPPGQRVQIILLDTRYFRSELKSVVLGGRPAYVPREDASATMLGEQQWTWLAEQLLVPAELRIIASSIQVVSREHRYEKWANLPRERQRLLDLLRTSGAGGVVVISGDRHLAELSRADGALPYPLYDLTSSGLTQSGGGHTDEPNAARVGQNFRDPNFGLIRIDWKASDPAIRLSIHDVGGATRLEQRLRLGQLQPQVPARPRPAAAIGR